MLDAAYIRLTVNDNQHALGGTKTDQKNMYSVLLMSTSLVFTQQGERRTILDQAVFDHLVNQARL